MEENIFSLNDFYNLILDKINQQQHDEFLLELVSMESDFAQQDENAEETFAWNQVIDILEKRIENNFKK